MSKWLQCKAQLLLFCEVYIESNIEECELL